MWAAVYETQGKTGPMLSIVNLFSLTVRKCLRFPQYVWVYVLVSQLGCTSEMLCCHSKSYFWNAVCFPITVRETLYTIWNMIKDIFYMWCFAIQCHLWNSVNKCQMAWELGPPDIPSMIVPWCSQNIQLEAMAETHWQCSLTLASDNGIYVWKFHHRLINY